MNQGVYLCAALLLLTGISASAQAKEDALIIGVLAKDVNLYAKPSATSAVLGTWPAKSDFTANPKKVGEINDSFLQVDNDGKKVWVMTRYVKANRQIRLEETCGALSVDVLPTSAATRGVGEKCKSSK